MIDEERLMRAFHERYPRKTFADYLAWVEKTADRLWEEDHHQPFLRLVRKDGFRVFYFGNIGFNDIMLREIWRKVRAR